MIASDLDRLRNEFEKQFPGLPVGGFHNPEVVCEDENTIEFRCFYDNYDNEEDSWTWYWDKKNNLFY